MKYPKTQRLDLVETLHGTPVPDPYRWMEQIDNAQVREWIEAENELTFSYLDAIPARRKIAERMQELWNFEKYGVPEKQGGRYFFTRNDGLQNQSALYWMENLGSEPKLLLDPNRLSEDGTVAMNVYALSRDGSRLAYGLSSAGSDWIEWRVRSVDSGEDHPDLLQWSKFSGASWTVDHQGFFYSRYDEPVAGETYSGANYYHKLYYHLLGTPQSQDRLIYERPDEKEWGFDGQVSEDGRYLVISVWKGTLRENGIFYLDLENPNAKVVELLNQFDAQYLYLGNQGKLFYFFTDLGASMGRVVAIDVQHPNVERWQEIIPEGEDAIESVSLVAGRFITHTLHDAHSRVQVFSLDGEPLDEVALPGMGSVLGFQGRFSDTETFYQYTSFDTPGTIYRYQVASGRSLLFRQPQLAFSPQDYTTEQVFYPSKDGTRIPMFIVRRRDVQPGPGAACYLYGYGGFNISETPDFSAGVLTWLEMGGIYAQANLRGGGEYGREWHTAGMKLKKQNVFDDFIAAAEWLVEKGYTSTPKLGIGGRSNGGLLVGACLTQRPDLFGVAVPWVGVLDMLRFHKFTIGWAWTSDYGSPDDAQEFEALLAYSPYHNVREGAQYPPTLVITGDHDDRVFPAHSFKFAAALQAAQGGSAPVLIRIDTQAGHGMGKPTGKVIEEHADQWAFIAHNLGMDVRL